MYVAIPLSPVHLGTAWLRPRPVELRATEDQHRGRCRPPPDAGDRKPRPCPTFQSAAASPTLTSLPADVPRPLPRPRMAPQLQCCKPYPYTVLSAHLVVALLLGGDEVVIDNVGDEESEADAEAGEGVPAESASVDRQRSCGSSNERPAMDGSRCVGNPRKIIGSVDGDGASHRAPLVRPVRTAACCRPRARRSTHLNMDLLEKMGLLRQASLGPQGSRKREPGIWDVRSVDRGAESGHARCEGSGGVVKGGRGGGGRVAAGFVVVGAEGGLSRRGLDDEVRSR